MKKLLAGVILLLSLAGCNSESSTNKATNAESSNTDSITHIVVGATPVPAAEILEFAKPLLLEKGVDMRVQVFNDYVTPDVALNDKSNDANMYQHKPYMDAQNEQRGFNLVSIAPVYLVPLGFYSAKYKSLDEIPDGAELALPQDSSNLARALILLHDNGLIELKDAKNQAATIEYDIANNPKNFRFKPMEASALPRVLPQVDCAVINANYALQAGMKVSDSFFHEDNKSEYVNILATRDDNKDEEFVSKLKEVLLSKEVADFIAEKYQGQIIHIGNN